jgi:hypothetical protein
LTIALFLNAVSIQDCQAIDLKTYEQWHLERIAVHTGKPRHRKTVHPQALMNMRLEVSPDGVVSQIG